MPVRCAPNLRSMTRSAYEEPSDTGQLDRLYWQAALVGTDPSLLCLDEPICTEGRGTAGPSRRVTILAEAGALPRCNAWNSLWHGSAHPTYVAGTAADALLMSEPYELQKLIEPLVIYRVHPSIQEVVRLAEPSNLSGVTSRNLAPLSSSTRTAEISRQLMKTLQMTAGDVSQMLSVSDRALRNWLAGTRVRLTHEKQLLWLHHLAKLVESKIGSERVREWFMTPIVGVNTPYDLIRNGERDVVARAAAAQFEEKATVHELSPDLARRLGFPFDVLEAEDDELADLSRVMDQ